MDGDLVVGAAVVAASAKVVNADDRVASSIRPSVREEARGELRLVTGGAHRDGDVDGCLAGARGADRERLLAAQPVLALLDVPPR